MLDGSPFNIFLSFYFSLLSVLNVVAPSKHFQKMKEFIALKLPPGFPVKIGKYVLIMKVLARKFYIRVRS